MAFTATAKITYNKNPLSTPVTTSLPGCYFKIDGAAGFGGGKDAGIYTANIRVYINQTTRENDIGDDYQPLSYVGTATYVAGQDPYIAIYTAEMAKYSDSVEV